MENDLEKRYKQAKREYKNAKVPCRTCFEASGLLMVILPEG